MNKLSMIALVVVVAGGVYISALGGAYFVLRSSSPAGAPAATTTVVTSATTSAAPPSSTTSTTTLPSTTATTTSTVSPPATSSTTTTRPSGQVVTVVLQGTGWNGTKPLVIQAKVGTQVTINLVDEDPSGSTHPLFLSGPVNLTGPTLSPATAAGVIQFTPTSAGTYEVLCLNPDCSLHDLISGQLQIIAS